MAPEPEFLVTDMSRQTAATRTLASARAFRRPPVRDGILHRDIKGIAVIRLRIM
jgi:hypothetical protein